MEMVIRNNSLTFRIALSMGIVFCLAGYTVSNLAAQAPAAAPAPATVSQLGTVKAVSGNAITMATDKGQTITVNVVAGAKVFQLAVGSTDLKTAKPGQMSDIAVGDRALVTGKAGDTPDSLTALRVVLMKSSDIAQMQAQQQADWKARGTGGIVSSVDPSSGTITITSGTKKLTIATTSKTDFKRFAGDSVKYQDAKPGKITDIQAKDQLQARGAKSADGTSMQAEEVISGSFENLSGQLLSVDGSSGKITLKDLATKKVVTVNVTPNSDIRNMPVMVATRFAAQSNGGGGGGGGRRGGGGGGQDASGGAGGDTARRSAGADLSQMIARFPSITLADLKKGDAVMIVASDPAAGASAATAVTVLTGVDPILTANPNGGMDLSMSIGGGGGATE
jgi:hypothetical protein